MAKRKIVYINHDLCNGCGECIPNCQEGALQIIDGKARLISDFFCDGLGACLGHCPMGAISIEEREAENYDECKVMESIVKQGSNTIKAHLQHLQEHNESQLLAQAIAFLHDHNLVVPDLPASSSTAILHACPGSMIQSRQPSSHSDMFQQSDYETNSELSDWPIQLHLVPTNASFLKDSHLLIAASCTAFALGSFHKDLLRRKKLIIACPKLDDTTPYLEKLVEIFKSNQLRSITVATMEVPCCIGLTHLVEEAIKLSGKNIPVINEIISIQGKIK
jgi:NAD-dependent dihydropyrimidine dehydrogenase PreA subunit